MMTMTLCGTILILGPDERLGELLLQWLAPLYGVVIANSPLQALQLVAELHPALLLFAYQLDEMNGIDLCRAIRREDFSGGRLAEDPFQGMISTAPKIGSDANPI